MVPNTEDWARSAGEDIQTACTVMEYGRMTVWEWKYWDLEI